MTPSANGLPLLLFALIVLFARLGQSRGETPADDLPLVIANVTLIDATGAPGRSYCTVVIAGGRIVEADETCRVKLPPRVLFVDARGKYLIPGLWDMHIHLPDRRTLDVCLAHGVTGVRNMYSIPLVHTVTAEMRREVPGRARVVAANGALDGPNSLFDGVAGYGIKTIADGAIVHEWVQATYSCTIALLRCVPPMPKEAFVAAAKERACRCIAELKQTGNDFIKTFSLLPRTAYFNVAAETRRLGIPLVGHVPFGVSAAEASDAGQRSIEHLEGIPVCCCRDEKRYAKDMADLFGARFTKTFESNNIWRIQLKAHEDFDADMHRDLFAKFVKNNTFQTPTLVESWSKSQLGDPNFRDDQRMELLPAFVRGRLKVVVTKDGIEIPGVGLKYTWADLAERKKLIECEMKLVAAMHKAGVPLLAGTDSPNPYCFPGSGIHDELELFVKCGMTPMDALQTATRNPARFLGREKELGTIEKGKLADLVLLEADPLSDIRNIRKVAAVVAGGKYLSKEELLLRIKK
jgi:hypothetical protein